MGLVLVDKVEVARRQITTAVRLFFENGDPVAIHTLVASAHQILVDLCESKGIHGALKSAKSLQGPDAKRYLASINFAFNFMKHADQDQDALINIAPLSRLTSDFLMDSVLLLQLLSGDIPIEGKVFWTWFVSKYPDEFSVSDGPIKRMQQMGIEQWDFKTIRQFLSFADVAADLSLAENDHE